MVRRVGVGASRLRTLVISDLHLGARRGADVLRAPGRRARLLAELAGCDRLVLLGDVLELRHDPIRRVLDAARPVLREIGKAVGGDGEVVVVPGNHDHRLLRGWLERRALEQSPPALGLGLAVGWRAEEALEEVVSALAPASVRICYPGVWLRDDVYAIHGHYSDRHITVPIMERLGAGVMARVVQEPPGGPRRAEDYEALLAPLYDWIESVAQAGVRGSGGGGLQVRAWHALQRPRRLRTAREAGLKRSIRAAALAAGFPLTVAALNLARIGPLGRDVSGDELRRAGLRAMAEVLERLQIDAEYVLFGHTHRAGPLPDDDLRGWQTEHAKLLNTGCWVTGEGFLGADPDRSPYRPGFCGVLDGDAPPRLVNLLDEGHPSMRAAAPEPGPA